MEPALTPPAKRSLRSSVSSEPSRMSSSPISSGQPKPQLSERKLSPTQDPNQIPEEGFSSSIIKDLCSDSLEMPRPHSKLLQFTQKKPGESRPRQILLPVFFHSKTPPKERELSVPSGLSNINSILENLRESSRPRSNIKNSKSTHKKTVSFNEEENNEKIIFDPDSVVLGEEEKKQQFSADSLEVEESKGSGSMATTATAPNSIAEPRINERLSTVFTSSESFTNKRKLAECSVHIEKLIPEEEKRGVYTTTAATVTTQGLHDNCEETPNFFTERELFEYEQEVKASGALHSLVPEFGDFPTVAYCTECSKEVVTKVCLEKDSTRTSFSKLEFVFCCCLPTWLHKHKALVHRCSFCNAEIAQIHA